MKTIDGVICKSHSRGSVLSVKSSKNTSDEPRVQWEVNLQVKHSALSADDTTSN